MENVNRYQQAVDKFIEALQELTELKELPWSDGPDPVLTLHMVIAPYFNTDTKDTRYALAVMTDGDDVDDDVDGLDFVFSHDDAPSDARIQRLCETATSTARKERP
jgi:hypothetical protein